VQTLQGEICVLLFSYVSLTVRKNQVPVDLAISYISKESDTSARGAKLVHDGEVRSELEIDRVSETTEEPKKTKILRKHTTEHKEVIQLITNFENLGKEALIDVLQPILPDIDFSLSSLSYY
jgi:hypothetical protein